MRKIKINKWMLIKCAVPALALGGFIWLADYSLRWEHAREQEQRRHSGMTTEEYGVLESILDPLQIPERAPPVR